MNFPVSHEEESDEKDLLCNELANTLTKQGIALLVQATEASLTEAVCSFDQAIALRRKLPIEKNHLFRYGLTAGWMNRGDALTRLGGAINLTEALRSYDEAISLMSDPSLTENPPFRNRLALAWMNRGITLQYQDTAESLTKAIISFDRSISLMQETALSANPDFRSKLACAWMNRANTLLRLSPSRNVVQARDSAKQALALSTDAERNDLLLAEISLKARHILCRSIGELLSKTSSEDLIMEASDAVDDGMKLSRQWERFGVNPFYPLAVELFRFGALFYLTHQPHFLAEFLLENLDPEHSSDAMSESGEMHRIAAEILSRAQHGLHSPAFESMNRSNLNRWVQIQRSLNDAKVRLTKLRSIVGEKIGFQADSSTQPPAKESQLIVSTKFSAS